MWPSWGTGYREYEKYDKRVVFEYDRALPLLEIIYRKALDITVSDLCGDKMTILLSVTSWM